MSTPNAHCFGGGDTAASGDGHELADLTGPFFAAIDLRAWLDLREDELHELVAGNKLLAVRTGDHSEVFPAWQFTTDGQPIPHLADVLHALAAGNDDPWTWALWLTAANEDWDNEPAWRWLANGGDPAVVLREARDDAARWAQ